jgi:glycosyltransferase involved in cell wall biosynthesis
MPPPGVSVVIAVRNGERFLAEAMRTVLAQTWKPLEILVVDGRSTDSTGSIAASFPQARCLTQRGRGIADAYNEGIGQARGEFIAFLSHDDRWTPDKLATQMEVLLARPELGFAVAHLKYFLEPGAALPPGFRPELLTGEHAACIMEVLLARRETFDIVGAFDTTLTTGEDVDWFARARDLGVPHAVVSRVLLHKRVHQTNLSLNDPATNQILLRVLRRSLERKRRGMLDTRP